MIFARERTQNVWRMAFTIDICDVKGDVFAPHHSLLSGAGQASWHKPLKSSQKEKPPPLPAGRQAPEIDFIYFSLKYFLDNLNKSS